MPWRLLSLRRALCQVIALSHSLLGTQEEAFRCFLFLFVQNGPLHHLCYDFKLNHFLMTDMLVNLLKLPSRDATRKAMSEIGIDLRRANPFEITPVLEFVEHHFSIAWADEISVGFANKPVSVFVAVSEGTIVGFAAYECTRRNFFGPTGVLENMRNRGIGKALLLECLWALREKGYVYGIIGGVGPIEFYEKAVSAKLIEDSSPGIYQNTLK